MRRVDIEASDVSQLKKRLSGIEVLPVFAVFCSVFGADLSSTYSWQPIRIGAGGCVVGFVTHPADATRRYVRNDTGQAYRWDDVKKEWIPLIAAHPDGSGLPDITYPNGSYVHSVATDPSDEDPDWCRKLKSGELQRAYAGRTT